MEVSAHSDSLRAGFKSGGDEIGKVFVVMGVRWGWKRDVVGVAGSFFVIPVVGMFLAFLFPFGYKTVLALLACVGAAWLAIRHIDRQDSGLKSRFCGKFIVLDGGDGCGKSTQVEMLSKWLGSNGVEVVSFRDPGDTVVGEKVREILLDTAHEGMGDNVEVLLYMAARGQLWKEKIGPALAEGKCVVMDRWVSSTCAYQGCAGGFGVEKVIRLGTDCLERVWPDLTIVLDVDLETSGARMDRQLDRMEQKGADYHAKVREGFLKLADAGENVVVVDASESIEKVGEQVMDEVRKRFV